MWVASRPISFHRHLPIISNILQKFIHRPWLISRPRRNICADERRSAIFEGLDYLLVVVIDIFLGIVREQPLRYQGGKFSWIFFGGIPVHALYALLVVETEALGVSDALESMR